MAVIDKSKYIKIVEIRKIVGRNIGIRTFEKLFPEYQIVKISDTYCFAYEGDRTEIINQISAAVIEHYFPQSIEDPYERVDYCLNQYDDATHNKYPVLFDTYKNFVYEKLTNSRQTKKNLMAMVNVYMNLFRYLLKIMDELSLKNKETNFDVSLLTEMDIRKIITSKDIPAAYIKNFGYYLTYLKENKQTDVDITIKVKQGIKIKRDDDFYTLEEWSSFVNLAVDIDKHIQKSMNNVTYAKCWLYLLLHLCLTWRKSDILSIPALSNLLNIEKYNLKWFEENKFGMKDANYIVSNTKLTVEQYRTQKTNAYKHFNIPDSFKLPVAIAIIIVEQWRRRIKIESLFGKDSFSNTQILTNYLGENMNKFSSIKANRTLLSLVDNLAEETGTVDGYIRVSTYMRSHKANYYNMSDTTSIYLHSLYSDTELNEVTIQLYDRGMFGWLYDFLLKVVEDEKVPQKEQTELIVQMKQGISADRLEQLSELLYQQSITKERVINEIMKLSDEIKDVIKKLAGGNLTSKQDGVMCIRENSCKYPVRTDCVNCEYSIPTVYTLLSVCTELNNIFQKKIPSCKYDRIRTMDKMLKLYSVVKEAEIAFGEEYVSSYVDSAELRQNVCDTYKLLSAKEENLLEGESG